MLFYLPEGECFWITGLINKINRDCQPLTQPCGDRKESEKQLGIEDAEGLVYSAQHCAVWPCTG